MVQSEVVIVGVGMMTAVGLSAPETAMAVRASMMCFAETDFRDHRYHPFTLAEVVDDGVPPLDEDLEEDTELSSREIRMLRLATSPLRECLAGLPAQQAGVPLVLGMPDTQTTRPLDHSRFVARLAQQTKNAFDSRLSVAAPFGRVAALVAINHAALLIRERQIPFVVAGAVDTYRDPYLLGTLDKEGRVKSSAHLDGFIPGEGAAFLLLARPDAAAASGLPILAQLSPVASGFERGHLYSLEPYRGDGLAATIQQLVSMGAVRAPVQEVFSSMNGESHWAKEWGVSVLRNPGVFAEAHGMWHPADCFGETGAASGALLVGLAAMGIAAGYRRSPSLAYCSSDNGQRAAIIASAVG